MTIENTDSDLKLHALHYGNELLVRVRLVPSFQDLSKTFANSLNMQKQYEQMFGKRLMTHIVADKSTDHEKPHFHLFFCFFFS